ncbi:uncharacterized protein CTRU02_206204 [Colletotrichum truncatum]|uniref:Uncharacterized protein n=1 Tax=Colletotrichum truncatum TaxID=5467 RepID=A0ACC3Z677_COLTU|nr:uncharacterized protein CTRU02_10379 [Colletotrichum truncatum]KAF6787116.1 hypothetical protein CTRU02_10379 [Colletotrichum truncatum]
MSDSAKFTVGWICALPIEFDAAQAFLEEEYEDCPPVAENDNNNYALGRIGSHNVVIAVLPDGEYGLTAAAVVARGMLHSFPNVRIGLMVGIGGGAPSPRHDIRLGDIVVSRRDGDKGGVFQYDLGKTIQNRDFEITSILDQPPMVLRTAVSALRSRYSIKGHQLNRSVDSALDRWPRLKKRYSRPPSDSDKLYRSDIVHPESANGCDGNCSDDSTHLLSRTARDELEDNPAIHYGLIASANQLMKDATIRDKLAKEHGVLCFEMEAAGLMNHFPCLVIRGICDYSDSHKNKRWQGFAAMMAAAYAADLLHQIPSNKVEAERRISDLLNSIQEDLGHLHLDLSETKNAAMATRNKQHLDDLHRWLSPPDPSTNAARARDLRHSGTGTWLLESDLFSEWKNETRQHLWLYGLAGCGKTVLSTTIIDHLSQNDNGPILTFFFDFTDTGKQTLANLLRSLAFQLYSTGDEAARRLDALFVSFESGRKQPDNKAFSTCLESMMRIPQRLTIVLDALDECTTRSELLLWMRGLTANSAFGNTKLVVTGRPEADFQREIPRLFGENNCMLLDKKAVDADIRSYVSNELHQRPNFIEKKIPQDVLDQIRTKVGDGADGMFRWAACQLDSLVNCLHIQAIKSALASLPRDLNETYQRMLSCIPSELKGDSIRLLQFLAYAERPLITPEAIEILATLVTQEKREFNPERRLLNDEDILRYCPGLLSFAKVSRYDAIVTEVQLAHFSVKEWLISESQFELTTASIAITRTCFTYINDITGTPRVLRKEFPLARYAAEVSMKHARLAETSDDIVEETGLFLQNATTFYKWGCLYQPDDDRNLHPSPPKAPPLYYACCSGLSRVIRTLLDNGADVNAQGGSYGNALQAASDRGYEEIVRLLLDNRADVNAQGGYYSNALLAASYGGYEEIVRLLLDKGADVNAQGGDYGNALQAASYRGHEEIVRLLLDKEADVNAQGGSYDNALQAASYGGHEEIVRLLLDKEADVNAQGGYYSNALLAASYRGYEEIVRLLLDNGADVNAQGGHFSNALIAASIRGYEEIVQLLLDNGADVNAQGGHYGNALQAASYGGYKEIVQLLLDNGADVNAQGGSYDNALQAASYGGHEEIVRLLLDKEADVNAQGGSYDNALQAASYGGHEEIVRLLLDNGADVNAQGGHFGNALQAASARGHEKIVRLLLDKGAGPTSRTLKWRCARQISGWRLSMRRTVRRHKHSTTISVRTSTRIFPRQKSRKHTVLLLKKLSYSMGTLVIPTRGKKH